MPHVAEYFGIKKNAFDCTLGGPFDDLVSPDSQHRGLSVEA
jgi:hypothetical protein